VLELAVAVQCLVAQEGDCAQRVDERAKNTLDAASKAQHPALSSDSRASMLV
jgi:hypothetical protein